MLLALEIKKVLRSVRCREPYVGVMFAMIHGDILIVICGA